MGRRRIKKRIKRVKNKRREKDERRRIGRRRKFKKGERAV